MVKDISVIREFANIIFFLGMPTIAALALYQARKTILAPRQVEYFKRQLEEYKQLSDELFFKEFNDLKRTLQLDKIAESTGLSMYDAYLRSNRYEASAIQDLIQSKRNKSHTQKMENKPPSIGCCHSQDDIAITEDSSEEEIAEYRKFCDNPNEYPMDLVTINYLVLPKDFVDKKDTLIKFANSIFIDRTTQAQIKELIGVIEECYEYLYIGAKKAGKQINNIHNDTGMHGLNFGIKTKSRVITELIMSELNNGSLPEKLITKTKQVKSDIKDQVKKQTLE